MSVVGPASGTMEIASVPAENRDVIRLRPHRELACRSMIEASIMHRPRLLLPGQISERVK
ncbi:hypothetical protein [Mesorhizobium sp. dw_380]|uniref:hypothetical protein n=1 Tax=Mesorhizobium sp. dw_380 TaxID=2812001 RepID=UPI001BDF4E30|nr:hypothetical protein [Mesorhizobium sp. dw_380]